MKLKTIFLVFFLLGLIGCTTTSELKAPCNPNQIPQRARIAINHWR